MSDQDPWSTGSGLTVTIKYGKGYDDSWLVVRGTSAEIRQQLIDVFGITDQWGWDVTLNELITEATNIAHGVSSAARTLGARAVAPSERVSEVKQEGNAWERAAADKAEGVDNSTDDKAEALKAQIASASTVDELKRVWAENQEAFKDESLMGVWKARGKELSK